ncbi:hypothetical protein [Streptomyces sp. TBY4]|uniref:hypothetical protein n=1 Tax=Streptomyces sp. TBY4 TaxID=2962030 RepID=UPI0020B7099A|nr:hypothetical protein [Streptomyces sp. TBY4]MCP3760661.1 hypothetical protein [Streptomyces sp. TBY4]
MSLRRTLVLLRVAVVLQAVLLFVQAGLAGGFLGGHFDMLQIHGIVGRVIVVVALLMSVAAFLVRRAGGPSSVFGASLVVVVALIGQMVLGLNRSVASHVLLGVTLVAAVAVLANRVMTTPLDPPRPAGLPERETEMAS